MEKFIWGVVDKFQNFRTKKLGKFANYLISKNIAANHLTFFSLISGILAVYFLFDNWWLLLIFTKLHLIFDALDGVVARVSGETIPGRYFDLTADSLPVFLILLKIGWYINDFYAYFIAILFALSLLIFFISKLEAPFIPMRTVGLIIILLSTSPPLIKFQIFLVISYIAAGVFSVYALAKQLQHFLVRFIKKY